MMRPVRVTKRPKAERQRYLTVANCPNHPRRRIEIKFRHGVVFKFHQNWLTGFRDVRGQNLPFPVGLYNSLYYRTSSDMILFTLLIEYNTILYYTIQYNTSYIAQ